MTDLLKNRSVVIFVIVAVLVLLPVKTSCGVTGFLCLRPPDEQGKVSSYYEIEPLGIKIVELFWQRNLGIFYTSGVSTYKYNN
jgi:hypothetical protein